MTAFDFEAYRAAVEERDAESWLAFYAPDAEWIEYRQAAPPRAPKIMRGHEEIGAFLHGVAGAQLSLSIENEVVAERRAAYTLTVTRPDGRRIVENIIIDIRDGLVVREVDVEAWD